MVMFYAPHTLYKVSHKTERDEYGFPVVDEPRKEYLTPCRCDDNSTEEIILDNGERYKYRYHIVCDGGIDVKPGDYVIAYNGESIRGEGKVVRRGVTNYYSYIELWV